MGLTDDLKGFLGETARALEGSARRVFMARAGNGWPRGNEAGAG